MRSTDGTPMIQCGYGTPERYQRFKAACERRGVPRHREALHSAIDLWLAQGAPEAQAPAATVELVDRMEAMERRIAELTEKLLDYLERHSPPEGASA